MGSNDDIYNRVLDTIDEVLDEKVIMLSEYFYFGYMFLMKFYESSDCYDLLQSIREYYTASLMELDREHEIYENFISYFDTLNDEGNFECADLEEIDTTLDSIESMVDIRILNHSKVYNFFFEMLESDQIRNRSYRAIKYNALLTQEKENKILSILK